MKWGVRLLTTQLDRKNARRKFADSYWKLEDRPQSGPAAGTRSPWTMFGTSGMSALRLPEWGIKKVFLRSRCRAIKTNSRANPQRRLSSAAAVNRSSRWDVHAAFCSHDNNRISLSGVKLDKVTPPGLMSAFHGCDAFKTGLANMQWKNSFKC